MSERSENYLIILSGSIACFKVCDLISQLVKSGAKVDTVISEGASRFVTEATLHGLTGNRPYTEVFDSDGLYAHLDLGLERTAILYCPASASLISRLASGDGSDLASLIFLSCGLRVPTMLAPAMNPRMYSHPFVRRNLLTLKEAGVQILGPGSGTVACGEEGEGRMLEVVEILDALREV